MAMLINRGRNKWLVRVFLGRDEATGKRIFSNKTIEGTKEEAQNWAYDEKRRRQGGALANYTIGALLDSLLDDYKVNGKDLAWATIVCDIHLRPFFGAMPAARLTTDKVRRYMAARQAKGRANATINHELALLRRAFNLGRQEHPPKVATVPYIPVLKENNIRKGFFEDDQYRALLAALPEYLRPLLSFAYFTGCRRGEILGLKWSQVDLIERTVRLEPGETKNKQGRLIPLASELFQVLAQQKKRRDQDWPECPWVFCRDGKRILDFRNAWGRSCKAAGLWDAERERPTRIFHDLRRTAVRNSVRAGVSERVSMAVSGHKTRSVFDRYNITSDADVKESAAKIQSYHDARRKAEEESSKQQAAGSHTMVTQATSRPS